MDVIVFFGHHKVGSSALQTQLAQSAPALLDQGVLYPVVTRKDLDKLDQRVGKGRTQHRLSRNVIEAHNALAFSMLHGHTGIPIPAIHPGLPSTDEMFALIREQVQRYTPHTVVLASEVFANFAKVTPTLIDELRAGLDLDRSGSRVRLFAFLRRVDDYLASWHAQRVRFGHQVRPLPGGALKHYRKGIHFDYRLMIEAWHDRLPDAELILRPYDRTVRETGSAEVFAEAVGLPLPGDGERSVNAGLHRGLLELARRANYELDPGDAEKMFRALLKVGGVLELPPSHEVELFGRAARRQLVKHFTPIHDWLSELRGRPFFDDFDMIGQRAPVDEIEANTAAITAIRASHMRAFTSAGAAFIQAFEPASNYAAPSA